MGKTIVSEERITTPIFRLAFPSVWEKTQINNQGAFKFRITMLFDKGLWNTELLPLRDLVKGLITQKFGVGVQPPKDFYVPYKDGDTCVSKKTGEPYDGFAGAIVLAAAGDFKRPVVGGGNAEKGIKPQEIIDPNEIYAGCYCKASVNAYLWDNIGGQGVSLGYLALQKVRDGKPFSKFVDASEDFEPITPELVDTNKEALFETSGTTDVPQETNLLDQL